MRARTRLTPDEWAARLNAEMERVLRNPEHFDPCVVWWARWRRQWLSEQPCAPARPVPSSAAAQYSLLAHPEGQK